MPVSIRIYLSLLGRTKSRLRAKGKETAPKMKEWEEGQEFGNRV